MYNRNLNITHSIKLVIAFLFLSSILSAQKDSVQIGVLAQPFKDSILIRWAPANPNLWQVGNSNGYKITRFTLTKDGNRLARPIEKKLTENPIQPWPLYQWEEVAKNNNNAAVLAQAVFGETFTTTVPGSSVDNVMAVSDEGQQRFTFALLAAEQSFKAAVMAGLGFVDKDVLSNETYLYKIELVQQNDSLSRIDGGVLTGFSYYEKLPIPYGVRADFGDQEVSIQWNYGLLKRFYSRYVVERSEDGIVFKKLDKKPVFNAQTDTEDNNKSLVFRDSIQNDKDYFYRIIGQTAFDQNGPPSKVITGTGKEITKFAPTIEQKTFIGEDAVKLEWTFDNEQEKTITGFEVQRANNDDGKYETVSQLLAPETRQFTYAPLQITNYFKVVALSRNGDLRPSFPSLVQPVDSIPPPPPINLVGSIDTTGLVKLTWKNNIELDLLGYRVYRANKINDEFTQITSAEIKENEYIDTLSLNTLNRKIYYRITAEDQRYNTSKFSEILSLSLPDKLAPSPSVITDYMITANGIFISWIPSSSKDVSSHSIFRKDMNEEKSLWEKRFETKSDTTFIDTKNLNSTQYSYTVIATDSTGLESEPANPIAINWKQSAPDINKIKFSSTANRELRFINLTWKVKNMEVLEYKLFRGTSENDLKLYKTLDGDSKSYNDVDLKINTTYYYGLQLLLSGNTQSAIVKSNVKY